MLKFIFVAAWVMFVSACAENRERVDDRNQMVRTFVSSIVAVERHLSLGQVVSVVGVLKAHDGSSFLYHDFVTANADRSALRMHSIILAGDDGPVPELGDCDGEVVVVQGRLTSFADLPMIYVSSIVMGNGDGGVIPCLSLGPSNRPLPPTLLDKS